MGAEFPPLIFLNCEINEGEILAMLTSEKSLQVVGQLKKAVS